MTAKKQQNQTPANDGENGDETSTATVRAETSATANATASASATLGRGDGVPAGEAVGDEAATLLAAEAALESAQAEIADLKDRLLRAVAETENLRRRSERELTDAHKYAVADFARDMLSVSDNLKRAIEAAGGDAEDGGKDSSAGDLQQLLDGVELTARELQHLFEKHGLRVVDPLGERLDPNLHQAMVQIDNPDVPAGTIVQVMQVGYVIHDRLLRAAMVAVAKGGPKPGADTGEPGHSVDTKA